MIKKRWTSDKVIEKIKFLEKKLDRRPVKRDDAALYQASRKFFGKWNNAMKVAGYKVKFYQFPNLPEELDENLAYFLGLVITDGHIANHRTKGLYKILIYTSYEEEKDIILFLIKNIFNYNASIRKRKYGFNKRVNYEIYISSKVLGNLLSTKYGIMVGNKSLNVRVPKIVFNSPINVITNFLRGVIDGDGCISKVGIGISSGSELFLRDITNLFNFIGIKCRRIRKEKTCYVLDLSVVDLKKVYGLLYRDAVYFYPRKRNSLKSNIFKE